MVLGIGGVVQGTCHTSKGNKVRNTNLLEEFEKENKKFGDVDFHSLFRRQNESGKVSAMLELKVLEERKKSQIKRGK